MTQCASCGKEITDGLDTVGAVGKEQCQACYLAGELTQEERKEIELVKYLKAESEDLTFELSEIDATLGPLLAQVKALKNDRKRVVNRLAWCISQLEKRGEYVQ